ncbi:hypothetical protein X474_26950 [Dethiosulfatarculus sandiegensis]|uniref:HTH tetR-type domain-containing protein n=2 Tax=Dethiosulfatarculus sandiegensis TaxID=1429043 RepID=A0A0D2J5N2_9BACT|nr:hypothetical protein X474_26950 [Dethiosulfatarculus sandiegensis]
MIAKKAKVGAGTIYRYFKGKEELINQLYTYWKCELYLKPLQSVDSSQALRSRFRSLWLAMADAAMNNPTAFIFIESHHHGAYLDSASMALIENVQDRLLEIFEEGIKNEIFRDTTPKLIAAVAYGSFSSMIDCFIGGFLEYNQENMSQVEEMCWQAVRR